MEAEFVITGLCAFHNLHNQHPDLLEPSVILVRTDEEQGDEASSSGSGSTPFFSARVAAAAKTRRPRPKPKRVAKDPEPRQADVHIPHLSFNSAETRVNEEARPLFQDASYLHAPGFLFLPLNGVEIEVANDPAGKLDVSKKYEDHVAKRDFYWPDAKGQWNSDYIPVRGKQPRRSAVVGLMRFGSGRIDATKLSPLKWRFERNGKGPLIRRFADEVTYTVPDAGESVVVRLLDIESRELLQELHFSPADPQATKVTLFVGNNDADDIDDNWFRLYASDVRDNDHFKFLNRIVSADGPGPIPRVVPDRDALPPDVDNVGGLSSGPCGPIGTNG